MSGEYRIGFNWRSVLGAIALAVVTVGIMESPVRATPEVTADRFKVAQVGVRSRINHPTPINLSPRTHIPLPSSNRGRDYYRHSRYNRYDAYGHDHHRRGHRRHRQGKGTVIIINPGNSSSYSNYSNYSNHNRYIRIIRK